MSESKCDIALVAITGAFWKAELIKTVHEMKISLPFQRERDLKRLKVLNSLQIYRKD